MNKCLYCGKDVKNKYCNVSCQNRHQNSDRTNKKYGFIKTFTVKCECCNNDFEVSEREKLFPIKEKYYCSISCANTRNMTDEIKDKISITLTKEKITKICECCGDIFYTKKKNQKYCNKSCSAIFNNKNTDKCSIGGRKSVEVQSKNRRSKNEIYFAELCKKQFENVLTNEPIFNGWDADVIIEDLKIAILWNGKWHYEKITEKHSVLQVQNRDKIKTQEIINSGYEPYIIKDMGKYNMLFVEEEFEKFIKIYQK